MAFLVVRVVIESLVRPHFASTLQAQAGMNLDTAWVVDGRMYHPSSRFWEFQLIETGIYLVLTLALLGLVAWWVDRRVS